MRITIDQLPTVPNMEELLEYPEGMEERRSFAEQADAFLDALPKFVEQVNEQAKLHK
jgi:hypothetical protein